MSIPPWCRVPFSDSPGLQGILNPDMADYPKKNNRFLGLSSPWASQNMEPLVSRHSSFAQVLPSLRQLFQVLGGLATADGAGKNKNAALGEQTCWNQSS